MQLQAQYRKARLSRDPRFDGKFFVAVKTTGIFCRPICPARTPAEPNVEYFQRADQALHSGYRPCIRCRPDSAPESWAWLGTQTTVIRAARLISEDPSLKLPALCEKLGIGERHLRALFNTHMGISPKQFQLSQRLLFAKQLLQNSNLSIAAVAQAAGFSNTRSLQQQFSQHLKISPLKLRRQDQSQHPGIRLRLFYRPPYNWDFVQHFLARRALPLLETIETDCYSRTINNDDVSGQIRATHNAQANGFDVVVETDNLGQLKPLVNNIRRVLDLDADPAMIANGLADAGLKRSQQLKGIRLPGAWSLYEAACRAICGQQVSVAAAVGQVNRLVEHLGKLPGGQYRFPSPARVAASRLEFLGMPESRRHTLREFSRLFAGNPGSDPSAWIDLKGIGPWTVDYARMRGCSEPDVWLGTDLVIGKQQHTLQLQPERAAPWRSYLTMQLWSMA